jgi:hypothetical protein
MRHLSAIKHLTPKSASPVRHRTRGVAHDDDTDPRILRDLLTMRWHALLQALLQALCAVVTEEQRVEPASVAASAIFTPSLW